MFLNMSCVYNVWHNMHTTKYFSNDTVCIILCQ